MKVKLRDYHVIGAIGKRALLIHKDLQKPFYIATEEDDTESNGWKIPAGMTFAQVGFEGISGGIEEFSKTKHLGKAVWGGFLDAVSSVGPLEGATLGASIGGMFGTAIPIPIVGTVSGAAIGGTIGLVVGGVNSLVQFFNPNFYDDLKDASYSAIDQSEKFINDVGKKIGGITNMISDSFTGFGKAIGFG